MFTRNPCTLHMYTLNESTRITRASGTLSLHRNYFQTNWYKFIHEWWEQEWMVPSFCYAKSLHCRLVIVIIVTHMNVLSTTAFNDLVMILYYDPCYAYRSSRSKEGFHQKCSYRSGGTCCSYSELTRLLGICPFLSTLQGESEKMSPLTNCDTIAPNLEINKIRFRHIDPDVHADIWY